MSFLLELANVYDCVKAEKSLEDEELPPIFHVSNKIGITVVLDFLGNLKFFQKNTDEKKALSSYMPCTEAAGQSNKEATYSLCENLDVIDFYGYKKKLEANLIKLSDKDKKKYLDKISNHEQKHILYVELLEKWCNSEFSDDKLKAVLNYVKSGKLCDDLEAKNYLKDALSGFIRWQVEDTVISDDSEIQNLWIKFYTVNSSSEKGLCYVTGENVVLAKMHPSKIRGTGDKAKLISSNDSTNFTFRGRFENANEACQIGKITTQKAHAALSWLIKRQGIHLIAKGSDGSVKSDLVILAWHKSKKIPNFIQTGNDLEEDLSSSRKRKNEGYKNTGERFSESLKKSLYGYYDSYINDEKASSHINLMVLNAATSGRLSILLYQKLNSSDFINKIVDWHEKLSWNLVYQKKSDEYKWTEQENSPSLKMIAEWACYKSGAEINPFYTNEIPVVKVMQRLIQCMLNGSKIPSDIEKLCIAKASNLLTVKVSDNSKISTDQKDFITRNLRLQLVEVACAIYKYNHPEEDYKLELEKERPSRSYLFGRLLAVIQQEENAALKKMGENRETNAIRYMQQFAKRPLSTYQDLYQNKLKPYRRHLNSGLVEWFDRIIQDISDLLNINNFATDEPLSGEYLIGYHCQLKFFRKDSTANSDKLNLDLEQELENN